MIARLYCCVSSHCKFVWHVAESFHFDTSTRRMEILCTYTIYMEILWFEAKKRYQAVGFPCNRMLKLSSSRGIRIDIPVLSVSWSFEDHSVNIKALREGLIEHEASDTGGVPRWQSSCPDRLAEARISL